MNNSKLVFLDETGAKTNMTRRYDWGPTEQRVTDLVPHSHWETTKLIHAIDCNGSRASMITNGPTSAWVFEAYVDWLLAPALRPGDILTMDNLSSHKNSSALKKIEATGAEVRSLPPYSPDLNPIEQIFSKIKVAIASDAGRVAAGFPLLGHLSSDRLISDTGLKTSTIPTSMNCPPES